MRRNIRNIFKHYCHMSKDEELLKKARKLHFTESGLAYEYAQLAESPEVREELLRISSHLYRKEEYRYRRSL